MNPSVSFYTLGCRLNQSETVALMQSFKEEGWQIVDSSQPADVAVINTCTVTENGDADTRKLVHRILRMNPSSRIALIGCQAQVQKERLAGLPNVHWIVGNARKMDLALILKESPSAEISQGPRVVTPAIPHESFTVSHPAIDPHHTRANLKIQDGCDFFCSFCEIPYARGRGRSREFADILLEARSLVKAGYKEVILTGINLGTYHHKSGAEDGNRVQEEKRFLDLLDALETIEGLMRIRISSIEPTTVPRELFQRMAEGRKLCRYLHIPLQSGSDEILQTMKRRYTAQEFRGFLERAHRSVPGICLGTDVIVGFPGETDTHFQETCRILRDMPLAYFHVFSYSERHFAKSRLVPNPVDLKTIRKRSQILRDLSVRKRQLFLQGLLGTTQKVLFEEREDCLWTGLTDNYVRVRVSFQEDLKNKIRKVRLNSLEGQALRGSLAS